MTAALMPVRRPVGYASVPVQGIARPVVELHVRADELERLRPGEHPGWGALLRELQDAHRVWIAHPPDDCFGAEPTRRFPSAALARWTRMRDGACVFPACGASAVGCELDHTVPDARGGQTRADNLGPCCGHDHDLKEQPGWRLDQPVPGHFVWTSPTGHAYEQPPRPRTPHVPDPQPFTTRSSAAPDERADDAGIWVNDPYPDDPTPDRGRQAQSGLAGPRPDDAPPF